MATMVRSGTFNVYVASSWRNERQPAVVAALRRVGFSVYDFRNPAPLQRGFAWSEVDPNWEAWTPSQFRESLAHPAARIGFQRDMEALQHADATVLVLPCGRSAHLELGYAAAVGQATFVLCDESLDAPELMYLMATKICLDIEDLVQALRKVRAQRHG
jgi:nucleoside 2-deoxyribosyltransferase